MFLIDESVSGFLCLGGVVGVVVKKSLTMSGKALYFQ